MQLTERVLSHLERAEAKEPDAWMRDDYRIAWITTLYASQGNPQPHVDATYRVLGLHPDKVWPAILARRRALLGKDGVCAMPADLSAVLGMECLAADAITVQIPPAGMTTRTGTKKSLMTSTTQTRKTYPPKKPCASVRGKKAA